MNLYEKIEIVKDYLARQGLEVYTEFPRRVWTRGDGARYKEANKIRTFDDSVVSTNDVWKELQGMYRNLQAWWPSKGKLKEFRVRGEFPSQGYGDAFIMEDVVFIRRSGYIQFGSTSILRNTSVWHVEQQ